MAVRFAVEYEQTTRVLLSLESFVLHGTTFRSTLLVTRRTDQERRIEFASLTLMRSCLTMPLPSAPSSPSYQGHVEYFLCCAADLDDPDGVVTQSCFNKHPLDRAEDDSFNSPVDTNYPGRFYIDPPCRGAEVDQTRPELEGVLNEGNVAHVRYKLPDIVCEHAILQMAYREYTGMDWRFCMSCFDIEVRVIESACCHIFPQSLKDTYHSMSVRCFACSCLYWILPAQHPMRFLLAFTSPQTLVFLFLIERRFLPRLWYRLPEPRVR